MIQIGNIEWNDDYWSLYEIGYLIKCGFTTFNETYENSLANIGLKSNQGNDSIVDVGETLNGENKDQNNDTNEDSQKKKKQKGESLQEVHQPMD